MKLFFKLIRRTTGVFKKLKFKLNSKKDYATNKIGVYYINDFLSMVLLDLTDYAPKKAIGFT